MKSRSLPSARRYSGESGMRSGKLPATSWKSWPRRCRVRTPRRFPTWRG